MANENFVMSWKQGVVGPAVRLVEYRVGYFQIPNRSMMHVYCRINTFHILGSCVAQAADAFEKVNPQHNERQQADSTRAVILVTMLPRPLLKPPNRCRLLFSLMRFYRTLHTVGKDLRKEEQTYFLIYLNEVFHFLLVRGVRKLRHSGSQYEVSDTYSAMKILYTLYDAIWKRPTVCFDNCPALMPSAVCRNG